MTFFEICLKIVSVPRWPEKKDIGKRQISECKVVKFDTFDFEVNIGVALSYDAFGSIITEQLNFCL